ncbi:MAG: hypothetical protein V1857_02215 [archaeon]
MSLREERIEYQDKQFRLILLELDNAVVVIFGEDPPKLGTLAVALPREETVTSSVLLGGKYILSARAIAERTASLCRKMSLVSVHTQISESEAIKLAVDLLRRLTSSSR